MPCFIHDFQFKEQNGYLRQGVCPNCKKKELFTSIEIPFVLRCDRVNTCGAELIVKEIYPDIFDDWSTHYPKTQQAPKLMTCHNYPEIALAKLKIEIGSNKKPLLVWALDNGAAGERAMRKFVGVKTVRSVVNNQFNSTLAVGSTLKRPEVIKCWVFQKNSEG